jgi:hypothetical protein
MKRAFLLNSKNDASYLSDEHFLLNYMVLSE